MYVFLYIKFNINSGQMINSGSKIDSKTCDIKNILITNMGTTRMLTSSIKIDSRMLFIIKNVMCQLFKFENM